MTAYLMVCAAALSCLAACSDSDGTEAVVDETRTTTSIVTTDDNGEHPWEESWRAWTTAALAHPGNAPLNGLFCEAVENDTENEVRDIYFQMLAGDERLVSQQGRSISDSFDDILANGGVLDRSIHTDARAVDIWIEELNAACPITAQP